MRREVSAVPLNTASGSDGRTVYVAFFRNLNLGRPQSPTRVQLEEAFAEAGAERARSVQTNGTVVFHAATAEDAEAVLNRTLALLAPACGFAEPACVRPLAHVCNLASSPALDHVAGEDVFETCVSFACNGSVPAALAVPSRSPRGDVECVAATGTEVFCVSRVVGRTPGSPNAYLEARLGVPFTSRSPGTLRRIAARFG
jgi:uncharacterized protein (DUF1697 family)